MTGMKHNGNAENLGQPSRLSSQVADAPEAGETPVPPCWRRFHIGQLATLAAPQEVRRPRLTRQTPTIPQHYERRYMTALPMYFSLYTLRSIDLKPGHPEDQHERYRGQECPRSSPTGNRLTKVDIPNGMHTLYAYDSQGRQTSIHHKDGATVKQGFDYAFPPSADLRHNGGQITTITHEDCAYWAYEYDGRDRLTKAERYDDTPSLLHRFTYLYDDGDNMTTKAVYDPSGPSTVTTVFTYNNANEQTNMNDGTSSIDMAYDAWGRLTSRDDGTYSATYAYRYGGKLHSLTSNFPSEGNVTYETGGDGKRRSRVCGADETWYNWSKGWIVLTEEDDADGASGSLSRTYIGRNWAHVDGLSPSSGTWKYYTRDNLNSSRGVWNEDKSPFATLECEPFGSEYSSSGSVDYISHRYTGLDWDVVSQIYFAPYRYYSPGGAHWLTRDPLGRVDGPNVYAYVRDNPVTGRDLLGLAIWLCRRRVRNFPIVYHAYFWDDDPSLSDPKNSCGRTKGKGEEGKDPVDDVSEDGPGVDQCETIPDTGEAGETNQKGKDLFKCCNDHANDGQYLPYANDCWSSLKRCMKKGGFKSPRIGGRW